MVWIEGVFVWGTPLFRQKYKEGKLIYKDKKLKIDAVNEKGEHVTKCFEYDVHGVFIVNKSVSKLIGRLDDGVIYLCKPFIVEILEQHKRKRRQLEERVTRLCFVEVYI